MPMTSKPNPRKNKQQKYIYLKKILIHQNNLNTKLTQPFKPSQPQQTINSKYSIMYPAE